MGSAKKTLKPPSGEARPSKSPSPLQPKKKVVTVRKSKSPMPSKLTVGSRDSENDYQAGSGLPAETPKRRQMLLAEHEALDGDIETHEDSRRRDKLSTSEWPAARNSFCDGDIPCISPPGKKDITISSGD